MAGMGAAAASAPHVPMAIRVLRAVGLGGLAHVPNAVLQVLLIVLLLVTIGAALWRVRVGRSTRAAVLALLIAAAVGLYASIYIAVSETGYWFALTILVLASFLSAWSGRRGGLSRSA
jgi:uncharacterized membrane protein YwaF